MKRLEIVILIKELKEIGTLNQIGKDGPTAILAVQKNREQIINVKLSQTQDVIVVTTGRFLKRKYSIPFVEAGVNINDFEKRL